MKHLNSHAPVAVVAPHCLRTDDRRQRDSYETRAATVDWCSGIVSCMAIFSSRVLRLLSTELTDTPLRQIDALFDDHGIRLGSAQPLENDESVRRERMRRYLVTLDLDAPADAMKLTAAFSDVLQRIVHEGGFSDDGRPAKWFRILREEGFASTRQRERFESGQRPEQI